MADPLNPTCLLQALRNEGVHVVEHPGWRTYNRNHIGAWGPIHGVMIHHTVTAPNTDGVALCYNGHKTLPGPLCHGVIRRSGTIYMVGNGRANHAGGGDPDVLQEVRSESYSIRPRKPQFHEGTLGAADGNAHFYGFECENLGNGIDPWPAAQVEAIVRAGAAIARAYGWTAKSIIGHSEWSDWKTDPHGPGNVVDMTRLRTRIAERLEHPASWNPDTTPAPKSPAPTERTMTPGEFWSYRNARADAASVQAGDGHIPDAYAYLTQTHELVADMATEISRLRADVAAINARLQGKP